MRIFGLSTKGLELSSRSLDFIADSASQAAANIANATTPGYKLVSSNFESAMAQALTSKEEGGLARTNPHHLPNASLNHIKPVTWNVSRPQRLDGNSVNVEKEVTRLAEMDLQYSAHTTIVGKEIGLLKSAISLSAQ